MISIKNLEIKTFDLNQLEKNSIIVIVGKKYTGKTCLVKKLLHNNTDNNVTYTIFKGQESKDDEEWYKLHSTHYNECTPIILDQISKDLYNNNRRINSKNSYIICDDKFLTFNDRIWQDLFNYNRYYKTTVLASIQSLRILHHSLRTNIDYLFIFATSNFNDRKNLFENYFSHKSSTFAEFCTIMDILEGTFNCLVIRIEDDLGNCTSLIDYISYYNNNLEIDYIPNR